MIGCLCIHGFTGSPYDVEPLVHFLRQETDWHIVVPTLPGHGETPHLKGVKHDEWIAFAEKELEKMYESCDKVYLVGFSMGGLIASYLTALHPVDKLVLLSAAAYYVDSSQLYKDIKVVIRESLHGDEEYDELFRLYVQRIMKTPISAGIEFRRVVMLVRPLLEKITCPTFIAQGQRDGVVPVTTAQYLYDAISADKKKIYLDSTAMHHICYSERNQGLFEEILLFLKDD